jgi:hypothetical protein
MLSLGLGYPRAGTAYHVLWLLNQERYITKLPTSFPSLNIQGRGEEGLYSTLVNGKPKEERRSLFRSRLHTNLPPVFFHNSLGNGQSQPDSFFLG